jgi:hypothetical protein
MQIARKSLDGLHSVHSLWREPAIRDRFRTAVSLHSHTMHSRESLGFVPRVLRRVPAARVALQKLQDRHYRLKGAPIPFERAFWRPPLHPHDAHGLECGQIWNLLGLLPLVSITDHDTVEACAELHAIGIDVPWSVEWTVPYQETVFHIGVHNLPPEKARELESEMNAATATPTPEKIAGLLDAMHAMEDVLVVLNHPFSCECRMEGPAHAALLQRFLDEYSPWLHALELNGLQPAAANSATIRLAAARSLPVISGGDRHCTEPNANLNLTNARSFAEFVHEIRDDGRSCVLFLPQYRSSIATRYIEFIWQAVRTYPDFPGRQQWMDRVFITLESGETVTFGSRWPDGGPLVIRAFVSAMGLLASPGMRAMLSIAERRKPDLLPELS